MKTFLLVKLALVPYIAFSILFGYGERGAAIWTALILFAAGAAWRRSRGEFFLFEIGSLILFACLAVARVAAPATIDANAVWLLLAGQSLVCFVSLALRRPWTSDYSRADNADNSDTSVFFLINAAISGLWGVLFALLAAFSFFRAPGWATTIVVATGALASIFGPKLAIRAFLKKMISARETYHWPAPALDGEDGDCDVAIVGAGIGGLSAAALLADAGYRVAVFDQHVLPGGYCHHYPRKARHDGAPVIYRFDAGPHDFSGVWDGGSISGLLERLGVADRIEWKRIDHSYRTDAGNIEPPRDWRDYARMLGERFPASAKGVMALFEDIRTIFDDMYATGSGRSGIPGLPADVDQLLKFPKEHPLGFKWMGRPFSELVAKHVSDPQVVAIVNALSGYLHDGAETLTCAQMVPIFGYYFKGGFYPVGGSGRFSEVLVEAIEERGGAVHLKTPVRRIIVESGKAAGLELRDGRVIRAKAVVSNADFQRTFLELVDPAHTPADFRARLASAPPANSCFTVQLGLDYIPDIKPATHVAGLAHVGIAAMSLVDPTAAPPGHSIMNLIRLLPYEKAKAWFPPERDDDDNWKAWRKTQDYETRKKALGDEMIAAAETILPGLSQHIVYRTDASPVTYARYDWASAGAIYGVSSKGRLNGSKSPVRNLVIAGGGNMGAGVEAVLISGAEAAEALAPGLLARPPGKRAGQALPTHAAA